jgi:hypothetical protein
MIFQYQQRAEPVLTPVVAAVPELAFAPSIPDRVPRLQGWPRSAYEIWPSVAPILPTPDLLLDLTFFPTFPDRVPKLGRWPLARHEAFPLLPAPDLLVDLTFASSFPDRVPRPRWPRSQYEIWPTFAYEIYPIPDLLSSLTYAPIFPDRVPHPRWPRSQYEAVSAAALEPAIAPTVWIPVYPDRGYARSLPIAQHPAFTDPTYGEALMVAARLAWSPTCPVVRPRRHYPLGVSVTTVEQTATLPCVEIIPIGLTVTGFIDEALTTPTLNDSTLTVPTFLEEDLC